WPWRKHPETIWPSYRIHRAQPAIRKVLYILMAGVLPICMLPQGIGCALKMVTTCGLRQDRVGKKWIWSPFLAVLGSGTTGFVYHGKFSPETYLRLLQEQRINVLCCTPTEYRMMAKVDNLADYEFPALHSAVSAGEPLNVEVMNIFQKHFGITVRDGYGQTENTLLLGVTKDMELKPGSMGKPTPGNDVAVIDKDGHPVPPGEIGDIAVKLDSPALFREYYKDPQRTQ